MVETLCTIFCGLCAIGTIGVISLFIVEIAKEMEK